MSQIVSGKQGEQNLRRQGQYTMGHSATSFASSNAKRNEESGCNMKGLVEEISRKAEAKETESDRIYRYIEGIEVALAKEVKRRKKLEKKIQRLYAKSKRSISKNKDVIAIIRSILMQAGKRYEGVWFDSLTELDKELRKKNRKRK